MVRVVILDGVARRGRMSTALHQLAGRSGVETAHLTLGEMQLGPADGTPPDERTDDASEVARAIADAAGVILASPSYHGSFSGILKNALDLLPPGTLAGYRCGVVIQAHRPDHGYYTADGLTRIAAYLGADSEHLPVVLLNDDFADGVLNGLRAAALEDLHDWVAGRPEN